MADYGEGYIKLVRGRCEIHLVLGADRVSMEIPVVRFGAERPMSDDLMRYVLERNGQSAGIGYFALRDNMLLYRALLPTGVDLVKCCVELQEQVEFLGPKILNVIKAG